MNDHLKSINSPSVGQKFRKCPPPARVRIESPDSLGVWDWTWVLQLGTPSSSQRISDRVELGIWLEGHSM